MTTATHMWKKHTLNKYIVSPFCIPFNDKKKSQSIHYKNPIWWLNKWFSKGKQKDMNKQELRESFKFDNVIALMEGRKFTDVMALRRWKLGQAIFPSYSRKC